MPDFRSISKRLAPQSAYSGYGGSYGYASGGPYGRSRALPLLPGARKDWEQAAGDIDRCSAVAICLGWLQDNFSQARLEAGSWEDPKTFKALDAHPVLDLVGPEGMPCDDYDADVLWSACILSWKVDGNVFLVKGRGAGGHGPPVALWWEPHFNVTPWHERGDTRLVSWYYVSRPEGLYKVDPANVIHIRDGIDKFNPMLGCARLKSTLRSIVGHNSAETYSASIVDSMGGLGALWSPDGEPIDEDEALGIAGMLRRQTTGENAGRTVALSIPGRVDRVALSPQEMALDSIPDRFEATICAAMGVNPMVVGLSVGAGMRSYANQEEADRQSWNNGLVPMQHRFARGLQRQLLAEVGQGATALRFDHSGVSALAKNQKDEADRSVTLFSGGVATLNESRAIVNLPPIKGGDDAPRSPASGSSSGDDADSEGDPKGSTKAFDPGQARDELGRFASGSGRRRHRAALKRRRKRGKLHPDVKELRRHHAGERKELAHDIRKERKTQVREHAGERKELARDHRRERKAARREHRAEAKGARHAGPESRQEAADSIRQERGDLRESHRADRVSLRDQQRDERADLRSEHLVRTHDLREGHRNEEAEILRGSRGDDVPKDKDKDKTQGKVAKAEHILADAAERQVLHAIGGKHTALKDGKYYPADVVIRRKDGWIDHVEVKSRINGSKGSITVHPDALLRKAELHATTPRSQFHTVVLDLRGQTGEGKYSGHDLYYKRGVGAYALSKMHKVKNHAELDRMIRMKDDELPAAARGSVPAPDAKLRDDADKAHASRLKKDRNLKQKKRAARLAAHSTSSESSGESASVKSLSRAATAETSSSRSPESMALAACADTAAASPMGT